MSGLHEPSSNWEIRVIGKASGSLALPSPKSIFGPSVSANIMGFELRDRNNPQNVGVFYFAGASVGFSASVGSGVGHVEADLGGWSAFDTDDAVTLWDFEGYARLTNLGAALGFGMGATKFTIYGVSIDQGSFWKNVLGGDSIDLSGVSVGTGVGIEGGVAPIGRVALVAYQGQNGLMIANSDVLLFSGVGEIIQQMSIENNDNTSGEGSVAGSAGHDSQNDDAPAAVASPDAEGGRPDESGKDGGMCTAADSTSAGTDDDAPAAVASPDAEGGRPDSGGDDGGGMSPASDSASARANDDAPAAVASSDAEGGRPDESGKDGGMCTAADSTSASTDDDAARADARPDAGDEQAGSSSDANGGICIAADREHGSPEAGTDVAADDHGASGDGSPVP